MSYDNPFNNRSAGTGFANRFRQDPYQNVLDYGGNLVGSPETVQALAQYGAQPQEIQATAGLYEANKLVLQLQNLPPEMQATTYNALSAQQKDLLRAARYVPPEMKEKQGLVGRLFGNVPYVSDAVENLAGAAAKPLSPLLDAMNSVENLKDRVFRTAYRVKDYLATTEDEGSSFGPGTWARAWREVEDGENTYDLVEYDQIARSADQNVFLAAYNLSKGETPEEVLRFLMGRGFTVQQATDLTFGKPTADVVERLDGAKVSVGRMFGDLLGDPEVSVFGRKVHLTSGFFDGVDAMLLDPTLIAGKVTKGVQIARWGVKGADLHRIDTLMRTEEAARGWGRVGSQLETLRTAEGAAEKAKAFDRLAHEGLVRRDMIQPLLDGGVRDVDTARVWMLNTRNALDVVAGGRAKQLLPGRLTARGEAMLNAKGVLRDRVDWLLDGPKLVSLSTDSATYDARSAASARAEQLRGRVGQHGPLTLGARRNRAGLLARRLSTGTPEVSRLRLSHAESAFELHSAAMMTGMPKYWADEIAATYLAAPHAARRRIEKGMLDTVLETAANGSDSVRAWAAQYLDDANDLATNRAYGIAGRDVKVINGVKRSLAITDTQLSDAVVMPSFTEVYGQSARMGMMDRLGAATHVDAVETYMNRAFRPGVLLRPALAIRNFGEEVLAHVLQFGSVDLLRARAALSSTTTDEGRLLRTLTASMEPGDVDRLLANPTVPALTKATMRERLKSITVDPAAKGKRALAARLGGAEMEGYLDEISLSATAQNSLARSAVLSTERGGMGYVQHEKEVLQRVKRGGKYVTVSLTEAGVYRQHATAGLDGAARLHRQLVGLTDSPVTRVALELWDDPQAPERVADFILSPEFARWRAMSERMLADNTLEGLSPEATQRALALDWANVVIGNVRDHVSDADGNVVDELLAPLRRGVVPDIGTIDALERKPPHVVARDVMLVGTADNMIQSIVQGGFNKIGEVVDWASRQPILLVNYADARRSQRGIEAALVEHMGEDAAKRLLTGQAMDRAIEDTLRYVDNPDVRSQASVIMRNIVPFWRAQEEFYRRWATITRHSPEAIRKAQLLMHGMQHSGFVQKDNQGRDFFVYPAPGFVQDAIRKVFGAPDLGVAYQFRGQVQYLNQGLDPRGVVPNVGPLVSVPLNLLAQAVPETGSVVATIVGEQGVSTSGRDTLTRALVPTVVRRLWATFGSAKDQQSQVASANLQAIQAAAAEDPDGSKGVFLRPDATPEQKQAFFQRMEKWARSIVAMRAIYGLAAPASPQTGDLAPKTDVRVEGLQSIPDEFRAMLSTGIPYEEAVSAFVARHPNGMPWIVSKTESTVTGSLPATQKAAAWLADHREFVGTYKRLVPFVMPADPGDFDPNAFRLELAYGLRQYKDGEQFYSDLALSGVLGRYHDDKDRKDAALEQALAQGHTALAQEIRRTWSMYLADFRERNPLFADYQAQSGQRVRDRESVLADWKNAAVAGSLPDTPGNRAISAMVTARDNYTASLTQVLGRRDAAAGRFRDVVDGTYLTYQRRLAATDPQAKAFYDRIIAPLDEN